MISYIRVRNLAIVEEVAVEPEPGLNILTGETGAGKSLLVDSLQFLSGARGSVELIRAGADRLSAELVFQVPAEISTELRDRGVEIDDAELIVKRELTPAGRGRVLINGSASTVRELTQILDPLLQIHGQNESHDRIAGSSFRQVLDLFASNEDVLTTVRGRYREWQNVSAELNALVRSEKDRLVRADLLKYQIDEISAADVHPEEDESLRSERAILANSQQIGEAAGGALAVLSEDDDAALSQLGRGLQHLAHLTRSVDRLRDLHEELAGIRVQLEEVVRELLRFSDSIRHDPARLEVVEERLSIIGRLKKKYGATIAEVLDHLAAASAEYQTLQDYESSVSRLQQAEQTARAAYREAAGTLSGRRHDAARRLEGAIQSELRDLAMEKTRAAIDISGAEEGPHGADRIEFLIAPNAGEELRPMNRIASGGELSRIQLAIAAALFRGLERSAASTTLVFDEIDAGIGGRVAEVVGRKLRDLSRTNQVICVTHLPQIASFATTHFRVWKEEGNGRTSAQIEKLPDRERRVQEIARMLGGEKITASAIAHARELLDSAEPATRPRKRASASAV